MIRGLVCDLDGTVYLSGRPLPGAVDALASVRRAGVAVVFVSNNPTVAADAYAERLTGMGIPTTPSQVLTSGGVTAEWLRREHGDASVLLVSERSLRTELEAAGVDVVDDPSAANLVVVSFDRTFDYRKWQAAFDALRRGAGFIATNADATCPVEGGEIPDCAGIIAALEATTGRHLDTVIGKPSPIMAAAALDRLRDQVVAATLSASEVLIVGDRIETDVRMGQAAGFTTALVLTGVSRREDLSDADLVPTHVLTGLAELPAAVGQVGAGVVHARASS